MSRPPVTEKSLVIGYNPLVTLMCQLLLGNFKSRRKKERKNDCVVAVTEDKIKNQTARRTKIERRVLDGYRRDLNSEGNGRIIQAPRLEIG